METILFPAERTDDQLTFGLSLIVTILVLGCAEYLRRHPVADPKQQRFRQMGWLVLMLVGLLAVFASVFSGWSWYKARPVAFETEQLITPYGSIKYADIRQAKIEADHSPSLLDGGRGRLNARLLIIEGKDGQAHVLSSQQYPVEEIMRTLRQKVKKQ